jgi:hypothetical protein
MQKKIHMTGKNVNNIGAFKFKSIVIQFTGHMHLGNMLLHVTACIYMHLAHTYSRKYYIYLEMRFLFLIHYVNKGITIQLCTQFMCSVLIFSWKLNIVKGFPVFSQTQYCMG